MLNLLLYRHGIPYIDETSGNYLAFAIVMSALFPVFMFIVIFIQNNKLNRDIKKQCVGKIIQDLANINCISYKELPSIPDILTDDDICDLNLTELFNSKSVDDTFIGNYNDMNYNIQEIELCERSGKNQRLLYKGAILKAKTDTNINGWIDIRTKESIKKSKTFAEYFVEYFIASTLFILFVCASFISSLSYIPYIYIGLFVLSTIICYLIAKISSAKDIINLNAEKCIYSDNNIDNIKEKVVVTTSDNINDVSHIVNTDFIETLDKLKILFNTPKIGCKIYSDRIFLAIDNDKNMFEMGGLFVSPKNKKVAEKFISQISGILLFLNYIDSCIKNKNA